MTYGATLGLIEAVARESLPHAFCADDVITMPEADGIDAQAIRNGLHYAFKAGTLRRVARGVYVDASSKDALPPLTRRATNKLTRADREYLNAYATTTTPPTAPAAAPGARTGTYQAGPTLRPYVPPVAPADAPLARQAIRQALHGTVGLNAHRLAKVTGLPLPIVEAELGRMVREGELLTVQPAFPRFKLREVA